MHQFLQRKRGHGRLLEVEVLSLELLTSAIYKELTTNDALSGIFSAHFPPPFPTPTMHLKFGMRGGTKKKSNHHLSSKLKSISNNFFKVIGANRSSQLLVENFNSLYFF